MKCSRRIIAITPFKLEWSNTFLFIFAWLIRCAILKIKSTSIFVMDDIHWSSEMEEAWIYIQRHPAVTLTIDLFFIGIVFVNPDYKVKQHFKIRF